MRVKAFESVPGQIGRHAIANPNSIAVVDGKFHLTYAELERQSDRLANQLRQSGPVEDRCIGLLMDRTAQFVIASLAVMKNGAAYLPMDASTPVNRVSNTLSDAGAVALLTNSRQADTLQSGEWRVIDVDALDPTCSIGFEHPDIDPNALAYVIYTSGSTGEPKGVEITHANLLNLIDWHRSAFALTSKDQASQVASLGFDAAVWEIWPYLTVGATVHFADDVTRRSAHMLRDWMVAEKITIGFVPTALAEQMIQANWPADTSLRILLTGGEALHRRPAAGLPFTVVNNYGPTECTVVATSGVVSPDGEDVPSIGAPIGNATALILNEDMQPVAPGEVGELCIAGPLVGRGYRNRPELTTRQFVMYVPSLGGSLRIFRTGDQARMTNGEIKFLGRHDDQVKIRGYRIELGEIEAHLRHAAEVEACLVTTRVVGEGGLALVAYVVPAHDAKLSAAKLQGFLAARLPDYMVPPYFVSLPGLPMLLNGKVETSALPLPSAENLLHDQITENDAKTIESNALLRQVSEIVESMLGLPSIDPDENFFMIGGHSMLGIELVARIRDAFGVKLTLRQLFTSPTVAALSTEVEQLAKVAQ